MTRRFTVRTTDLCSQVLDKARLVYLAARVAELLNRHGLTDGES